MEIYFSFKNLTFMICIVLLMWFPNMETCNARRVGRHWRHSPDVAANSLSKRKSKNHHHSTKYKHRAPSPSPKASPPLPPPPATGPIATPPPAIPPPSPPPAVGPIQIPPPKKDDENALNSTVFTVLDFGAKGDGNTDDTKAFQAAWAAACKIEASLKSSLSWKMPRIKPTALRFYGSFNVTVTGITIQNSPQCHLKFDNCIGVSVYNFTVSSPGDSPNTDGIHLQNSKDVLIRSSNLACGDDCVSIQTGCTNVYIHNVNCGPGHGISIGGLGKDNTKACVSNITVRDVVMHNTMNGVRIKTWQGGSGSVQGVQFSNIQVSEVQLPIVIDQYYCDKSSCKNQTSAVSLSGINYENIRGTYTVKPVHFACSDNMPCTDVTLTNVKLTPQQEGYHMFNDPFCWQTFGQLFTPTIPPVMCLQIGKPASNKIQGDHDSC
ncbi:polygalacturonase at1g48100 [Phtheirospermum japonicum]|uniref:Polygalacturonase at1g48100 n=1 Tax=Phtheirospermum japonicum TaxID=374723 RepID=A0A830C166_9LAMI|nr:polygalacturonase at1g48100 [Phtheirospermum japonicum]